MKTRIVLGVGLLATLSLIPVMVGAQPSGDVDRVRQLLELQDKLVAEQGSLQGQTADSIRNIDARLGKLKAELDELTAKRDAILKSYERRRHESQERLEKVTAEIQALNASAAPRAGGSRIYAVTAASDKRDSLEEKLNQILKRLDMMETRLDRLERAVKSPQLERTPPK
jgi:peptidoglycan hydrolase CwlO-like protein